MGLQEVWENKQPECLPGSINDFMEFIGSDKDAIQGMDFFCLINLVKEKIKDCGSFTDNTSDLLIWRWQYGETTIEGRGKSLIEAALDGLIDCWIIFMARKENQCV